jgi:hypothetical protein
VFYPRRTGQKRSVAGSMVDERAHLSFKTWHGTLQLGRNGGRLCSQSLVNKVVIASLRVSLIPENSGKVYAREVSMDSLISSSAWCGGTHLSRMHRRARSTRKWSRMWHGFWTGCWISARKERSEHQVQQRVLIMARASGRSLCLRWSYG